MGGCRRGLLASRPKARTLKICSMRLVFCLSVAAIAAAIADPLVEFASNSGWFGHGSFTDRSNLDVVPALLAGIALLASFMVRKARAVLAGGALPRGVAVLVPWIFILQLLTLYLMETAEQFAVFGHTLGPTTWLGGPTPFSLTVHGAVCLAVSFAIVHSRRKIAATTLRVIGRIVAICRLALQGTKPIRVRRFETFCQARFLLVLCAIGERAPP
jgi:hypothetical protein